MSDFNAKMHRIRFPLGLYPRPRWSSVQRSLDLLAVFNFNCINLIADFSARTGGNFIYICIHRLGRKKLLFLLNISVFTAEILLFSFFLFLHFFFQAHVKIASRIVSYRKTCTQTYNKKHRKETQTNTYPTSN